MAPLRSLAFNLFYWTSTALTVVAALLVLPIPAPGPLRWILHAWARLTVWAMRTIGGMRVEVRGREHMPVDGPALIASKHQSECDGTLMASLIPGIAFVAMKELFSWPLVGAILYRLDMIRVDTCGGERERRNLATFARRAIEARRVLTIYPEGHLMPIGDKERYRTGIYYMARDLDLPVTPVATCVGLLWPRWSFWKSPGRAAVEFLAPMTPAADKDSFMRDLEESIEAATARLVAEFTGRPYQLARYAPRSEPATDRTATLAAGAADPSA
ncbi:MAG: 1-acyl-sn-glycerol-3-phosphate acyltransferase [Alphaproteobacteria bacterium]|nr:1-acyl-sn-glycerol-3-phosphate acyltransferase [Alphaproteobacteria bacterium]